MLLDNVALDAFLTLWANQLASALEMFTGARPEVAVEAATAPPADDVAAALCWKQPFSSDLHGQFDFWTIASETSWLGLGQALGETAPDACRSLCLEALGQAHHGAANALTEEPVRTFRCSPGEETALPDPATLAFAAVSITLAGAEPLTLFVALDAAMAAAALRHLDAAEAAAEPLAGTAMMERLREVHLPISLVIGSTELSISEVLAMKPGARVLLNKEAGDQVDLLIHGTIVARGEIVLVKENYGIRIQHIVSRTERLALCPSRD